jgi:hypothetical protein
MAEDPEVALLAAEQGIVQGLVDQVLALHQPHMLWDDEYGREYPYCRYDGQPWADGLGCLEMTYVISALKKALT